MSVFAAISSMFYLFISFLCCHLHHTPGTDHRGFEGLLIHTEFINHEATKTWSRFKSHLTTLLDFSVYSVLCGRVCLQPPLCSTLEEEKWIFNQVTGIFIMERVDVFGGSLVILRGLFVCFILVLFNPVYPIYRSLKICQEVLKDDAESNSCLSSRWHCICSFRNVSKVQNNKAPFLYPKEASCFYICLFLLIKTLWE